MSSEALNVAPANDSYRRKWSSVRHHSISTLTPEALLGTSWPVATFLLINGTLSIGVLNFPFVFDKAGGILFAILIQLILQVFLISTMFVLVYCADLNYSDTYHDVLLSMCGKKAHIISAISIMLNCFGICIAILMIIGDLLDLLLMTLCGPNFYTYFYLNRKFTVAFIALLFICPMCYSENLDFLKQASVLGIFVMLYPAFLTVYEYCSLDINPGPIKIMPENFAQMMVALPIFLYAYQTHEIVVPIYACLTNRNLKDFSKMVATSTGVHLFIYCITGIFGYLTFGSDVTPDFLTKYDGHDPAILIAILILIFKMITTYPQIIFCGRGALDALCTDMMKLTAIQFASGEYKRRIIMTTLWLISSVLLAALIPGIAVMFELLGCLAAVNIFIFPGMCLIALVLRNNPNMKICFSCLQLSFGILYITFGTFIFVYVLVQVVIKGIRNEYVLPSAEEPISWT